MEENKRRLKVIQGTVPTNRVVDGTTCFSVQATAEVDCQRQRCQHWIPHPEGHNCVMISAQNGPHTLQKIGQIYGLTRMRICQIEKSIFEKIRKSS
jgi:sigma-70-like protein